MAENRQRVSSRTHPELGWTGREKGTYIVDELFQSDAFRTLTSTEKDICLFVFTRRKYLKHTKKTPRNTWEPVNGNKITIPHAAIREFFSQGIEPPPVGSTITRAINALMTRGFLEAIRIGGNGKGDMTVYRLAHEWRLWRKGDPAVYSKSGMSSVKGFCMPGAGEYCPVKNQKRDANSHDFLHADSHEKGLRRSGVLLRTRMTKENGAIQAPVRDCGRFCTNRAKLPLLLRTRMHFMLATLASFSCGPFQP